MSQGKPGNMAAGGCADSGLPQRPPVPLTLGLPQSGGGGCLPCLSFWSWRQGQRCLAGELVNQLYRPELCGRYWLSVVPEQPTGEDLASGILVVWWQQRRSLRPGHTY